MRFDVDDISKKTKQHANECSRYLVELDEWERNHMQVLNNVNQRVQETVQRLRCSNRSPPQSSQVEIPEYVKMEEFRNTYTGQ